MYFYNIFTEISTAGIDKHHPDWLAMGWFMQEAHTVWRAYSAHSAEEKKSITFFHLV